MTPNILFVNGQYYLFSQILTKNVTFSPLFSVPKIELIQKCFISLYRRLSEEKVILQT